MTVVFGLLTESSGVLVRFRAWLKGQGITKLDDFGIVKAVGTSVEEKLKASGADFPKICGQCTTVARVDTRAGVRSGRILDRDEDKLVSTQFTTTSTTCGLRGTSSNWDPTAFW